MKRNTRTWEGLQHLEPRQLLAAISWDGGGGDLSWHNPLNWSGDVLPGPDDDVSINIPGASTISHSSGSTSIRSLTSAEPLSITGSEILVATLWRQVAPLSIQDATVGGPGHLLLNADAVLEQATLGGAGRFIVSAQRTLRITGDVTIARPVTNAGEIVWSGGSFNLDALLTCLPASRFTATGGGLLTGTGTFTNGGILRNAGAAASTTIIAVTFSNLSAFVTGWTSPFFPAPLGEPEAGVVDVHSGTLQFTGTVLQKQGTALRSGHWWVTSSVGRLLLPGPAITTMDYLSSRGSSVVLRGAGSHFPQVTTAETISILVLENRAFPVTVPTRIGRLTVDQPGAVSAPLLRNVGVLSLSRGRLMVGDFHVDEAEIAQGAELTVTGATALHNSYGGPAPFFVVESIQGGGTLRVTGTLRITNGHIGVQTLIIGPSGLLELPQWGYRQTGGQITSRTINYGTVEITSPRTWAMQGDIVNRGVFNVRATTAFESTANLSAPARFHNFGTFNVLDSAVVTFRATGAGARFVNYGEVNIQQGFLRLFGGIGGGGNWQVAQGSELAMGGLQGSLSGATITAPGLLRVGTSLALSDSLILGDGALIVGSLGRLEYRASSGQLSLSMHRSLVQNLGTFIVPRGTTALLSGSFENRGMLDLGGSFYVGNFRSGSASTLRVRSFGPTENGHLGISGAVQLAGRLLADFAWAAPPGTVVPFFSANTIGNSIFVNFSEVDALGLPMGLRVAYSDYGYRNSVVGQVTVLDQ
jgi:hypothetical protein